MISLVELFFSFHRTINLPVAETLRTDSPATECTSSNAAALVKARIFPLFDEKTYIKKQEMKNRAVFFRLSAALRMESGHVESGSLGSRQNRQGHCRGVAVGSVGASDTAKKSHTSLGTDNQRKKA